MGGGITVAMALVDCVPVVLFMAAAVILQRDLYDQLPKGAYSLVAAGSIMAFLGGFMKALWKILYATGVCDYVLLDHALFTLQGPGFLLFFLGLTGLFWKGEKNAASARFTNYDIDYQGNLNLIEAARVAGVRHFGYVSVINADKGEGIPMVHSKYLLEEALKASGLTYVIWRPTGYFYDIAHVFWPMIKSKSVQLLKTKGGFEPRANVVDTRDFTRFILETMCDENETYSVGGTETYTYRQIAEKS